MAMNKKEKEAMAAAILKAETLAALRWTSAVFTDVKPPISLGNGDVYSEGYSFNAHYLKVEQGWSSCIHHGSGPAPKTGERYRSASQNKKHYYSTKKLAYQAMRNAVEMESANRLLAIDKQIAACDVPQEVTA